MNPLRLILKSRVEVPCTVEVENTFESLHAHVELPEDIDIQPGDSVIVHGRPIRVPYGESYFENRTATVVHASALERAWTRMTGDFEFMELCEFSFSSEKEL
ncbi:MAG: hypothetical protein AAGB04_16790 [Pseudomonadota bacterium]